MTFIFSTSESDTMSITKDDNGNYFERRYGLPCFPLTIDRLKTIAWFECNRRGYFRHLSGAQDLRTYKIPACQSNKNEKSLI